MVKKDDTYKNAVIFDDTISAEDVCQGALGDCYLLAAFATLCERKVFIQNCFLTTTYNPYGKYKLRFYDLKAKRYVVIVIDDYIPCNNNKKPIFTKFNGHEMWPLLLEKAYAKFKGNYHNIEKGNPLVALKELTGFEGEQFIGGFNEEFAKGHSFDDNEILLSIKQNLNLNIKTIDPNDGGFVIHQWHPRDAESKFTPAEHNQLIINNRTLSGIHRYLKRYLFLPNHSHRIDI
jgi:hypothetical protein